MKTVILSVLSVFAFTASAWAENSSISQLMAQGQPVSCTFTKEGGSQSGTIYVADRSMRGDFTMNEGGREYPMHMIIEGGQKMYSWGGAMGEQQGMVMSLDPGAGAGGPMGNQGADMNEEMDFSCQPWSPDTSKFEPPSDVQFIDMAQMMNAYAGASVQQAQ